MKKDSFEWKRRESDEKRRITSSSLSAHLSSSFRTNEPILPLFSFFFFSMENSATKFSPREKSKTVESSRPFSRLTHFPKGGNIGATKNEFVDRPSNFSHCFAEFPLENAFFFLDILSIYNSLPLLERRENKSSL